MHSRQENSTVQMPGCTPTPLSLQLLQPGTYKQKKLTGPPGTKEFNRQGKEHYKQGYDYNCEGCQH